MDDVDLIIDLSDRIAAMEKEVKALKAERAEVESRLTESWAAVGKQSESRRGITVYRSRDMFCSSKAGQAESLRDALDEAGLGDMIKEQISMPSVKSWIREHLEYTDEGELDLSQIPLSISEKLTIFEQFSIRIRKS